MRAEQGWPSKRPSPDIDAEHEGAALVMRPTPRRVAAVLPSPKRSPSAEGGPVTASLGLASCPSAPGSLGNPTQKARKSAWATYKPAAASMPALHRSKGISPPPANESTLATQAAAQRLWEQSAAADSDVTASATPPSDSPGSSSQPRSPAAMSAANMTAANNLSMLADYNNALNAHWQARVSLPSTTAGGSCDPASRMAAEPNPAGISFQPPTSGTLRRPKAERAPANGSLSILPETGPLPATCQATFSQPRHAGENGPGLAYFSRLSQQMGDVLRSQYMAQAPSGQLPVLKAEPPIYGGASSLPLQIPATSFPAFSRYSSQESFKDRPYYQGSMDVDPQKLAANEASANCAALRWNSTGSMASESSLYAASSHAPQHVAQGMMPNMSASDSATLMQALRMLCQANEMAAVANSRIQAFSLAASANLEAAANGIRKRKVSDFYDDAPKRHNSLVSEGDNYYGNGHQQVCTECGTTSTPTWRRSGKRLMCNACGLRRSRSVRSARSNSVPIVALPQELARTESQKV